MKPWSVDTVFFDAAGTLFRPRGSVGEIYGRYAASFGLKEAEDQDTQKRIQVAFTDMLRDMPPLSFAGKSGGLLIQLERQWWRKLVGEIFAGLGPFPRFDEFFEVVYDAFKNAELWELEPNCRELLDDLFQRDKRLGIISNFDSRLGPLLEDLGLAHYFRPVVTSSQAPAAKPDPNIFRFALTQAGALPRRSLHIGDSLDQDYQGARSAGLHALLYDPRNQFAHLSLDNRIRSLAEVSQFLI